MWRTPRNVFYRVAYARNVTFSRALRKKNTFEHVENPTKQQALQTKGESGLQEAQKATRALGIGSAASTGVPAMYSRSPTGIAERRAELANVTIPRIQQAPLLEEARSYAYNTLAVVVGAILLGIYLASSRYSPAHEEAIMTELVAELRKQRKQGKKQLLEASNASGTIPIPSRADVPVSQRPQLRWWSTGPSDADVYILLAATEGDSSTLWGTAHALLATRLASHMNAAASAPKPTVRIVTFHKHVPGLDPVAPATTARTAVTLHSRDVDLLLRTVCPALHNKKSTEAESTTNGPKLIHVAEGTGVWGSLFLTGLRPTNTLGAVLVHPVLTPPTRHFAWMEAIPAASKLASGDAGQARSTLAKLLEPPAVEFSMELQETMDKLAPRRKTVAEFFGSFGTSAAKDAAENRFAEDFRRANASRSVLSDAEMQLLSSLLPKLRSEPQPPSIRLLGVDPSMLPTFVHADVRTNVLVALLSPIHAIGSLLLPPQTRHALLQARDIVAPVIRAELRGHDRQSKTAADAVEALQSLPPAPAVFPPHQVLSDLQRLFRVGSLPPHALSKLEEGPKANVGGQGSSALSSLLGNSNEQNEQEALEAGLDELHTRHAISKIPYIFRLKQRPSPEQSFSYLWLQNEVPLFGSLFRASLVTRTPPAQPVRSSASETITTEAVSAQSASTESWMHAVSSLANRVWNKMLCALELDGESQRKRLAKGRGLLCLPLQAPDAIVEEVVDLFYSTTGSAYVQGGKQESKGKGYYPLCSIANELESVSLN